MPSGSDSSFVNIQTPTTSPSTTVTEHRPNRRKAHLRTVSSTLTVAEMDTSIGDQAQWVDVPTSPKKREWMQASSPISASVHAFLVERAVADTLASQSTPPTQSEAPDEPSETEGQSTSSTNSSTTNFIDTLAQGALSLLTGKSSRSDEPSPPPAPTTPPLPNSPPRTPQDDDTLAQQMAIASIWC